MDEELADPLDMDMSEIFDDFAHDLGEFHAKVDETFPPFEKDVIKQEPLFISPPLHNSKEISTPSQSPTPDDLEQQRQMRRRAQIAASGRRGRAKRKREKQDLEAKNKKLEEENRQLQATIAELQFEMQRASSEKQRSIFEMENEILKKQVTEHRSFVQQVQQLMKGPNTTSIERKRLIQQGSNSAVAQLLGLLYASESDPSWQNIKYPKIQTEFFDYKCGKYQYLPFNAEIKNAKRWSLRADVLCKAKAKYLAKVLWDSCFDKGKDYDSFVADSLVSSGKVNDAKDVQVGVNEVEVDKDNTQKAQNGRNGEDQGTVHQNIEDFFSDSETTKIRKHVQVKKMKGGEESTVERLSVVTIRTGLRVHKPLYETSAKENEEVIIVSTIASDTLQNLTEKEDKVKRDGSTRITGYIFRNRPNGKCLITVLWSKPISKDGWVGLRPQDELQIFEDGSPNPHFTRIASMFVDSAAKQAKKLEKQMAERKKNESIASP